MGREINGRKVTEAEVDAWVAEAEEGYSEEFLRARVIGRPARGSGPAQVIPVRLTNDELDAVMSRAKREQLNRSEAIRAAIEAWAHAA